MNGVERSGAVMAFTRRISARKPPSASEAKEDDDCSSEADQILVAERAHSFSQFGTGHRRYLVDHETARLSQPIPLVRLYTKAKQRGFGLIGGEGADRHRLCATESIILDDRDRPGFADVSLAGSRGPDLAAFQSSSELMASMNA